MTLPVRARLALWYAGVFAVFMAAFGGAVYLFVRRASTTAVDASLAEAATAVADAVTLVLAQGQTLDDAVPLVLDEVRFRDLTIAVLDSARGALVEPPEDTAATSDGTAGDTLPVIEVPLDSVHVAADVLARALAAATMAPDAGPRFSVVPGERGPVRMVAMPRRLGGRALVIGAARSLRGQRRLLRETQLALAAGAPLLLLLATGGGYLLARQSLRPVAVMTERAARIGAATLHERIPVARTSDELGRLATVLNELLARVDAAFDQQRQLIADASHELRTPVAILSSEAELALARDRDPASLRAALTAVRDEARRLQHVVDDLFLLARANAGERLLVPEELYLGELAAECVQSARALAARKGISLVYEGDLDLPYRGDAALLRRLLLNLLDNAIKYTPAGGAVRVAGARRDGTYVLDVTDTGPGVPEESRDRLFDRFHRARRERDAGESAPGAGLGLAIARWIAEVHGGTLQLAATGEAGSVFRVVLPDASPRSV